ncbi:MAG: HAD family hydrolase [Alphaproteobacteria bacterium]
MHGLIFDWDNTLVNTIPVIKQSVSMVIDKFEYNGDRDEILASAGVKLSLREGFPTVFGDKWMDAGKYYYECYEQNSHLIDKMPHFDELIEYISTLDVPIAINSNKKQSYLEAEVKIFGMEKLTNIFVGSGYCDNDKPSPDGVFTICKEWGIKPSKKVYYIGDSDVDEQTANNSGLSFFHVNENDNNLKDLVKYLKNI